PIAAAAMKRPSESIWPWRRLGDTAHKHAHGRASFLAGMPSPVNHKKGKMMHDNTAGTAPSQLEQWERFVAAATEDYRIAIQWYEAQISGRAEGPEDVRPARGDVLAAHAALDLARAEL